MSVIPHSGVFVIDKRNSLVLSIEDDILRFYIKMQKSRICVKCPIDVIHRFPDATSRGG